MATPTPTSPDPPSEFDPVALLSARFTDAIVAAFPDRFGAGGGVGGVAVPDGMIAASKSPQFGDYQSNAAMSLGKLLGVSPRDAAKAIVAKLDLGDLAEPVTEASIAGPGFINVRLRGGALARLLGSLDTPALGLVAPAGPQTRAVVDLCGVNLAKQTHVGHLRSIIIGDALARTLERLGVDVVRQNHVGDWGLPIAMVVNKLMEERAAGRADLGTLTLDQLETHYRAAQRECEADERGLMAAQKWWSHPKAVAELEAQVSGARERMMKAKATLVALQNHEAAPIAVWQRITDITMKACLDVCARLHAIVRAQDSAGESTYAAELAPMVEDLLRRGVAEVSEGAVVVRVEGIEEPAIIRKSEKGGGGFLYATTDMAAIRRRVQKFGASRVIYCVDARQSLHFKQVFGAAIKAGFSTVPGDGVASLEHAAFGTVLGPDGRPFKTRSGENVKLDDLIDEAIERAGKAVLEKNAELPDAERKRVAEAVGVAAIKYADLSVHRVRDYEFNFDRMLAFEGNTGVYLLYSLARTRSIYRKAVEKLGPPSAASPFVIGTPEEKNLALALLRYPGTVRSVAAALEPNRLCQYLYDLAGVFSVFYTNCPVIQAPDEGVRASRLRLTALTERVLADGLGLLGIQTLERM
jgi:arginyl-tRNA synthetase